MEGKERYKKIPVLLNIWIVKTRYKNEYIYSVTQVANIFVAAY